jgi:transcriptional regulator with XRE-family HTH domain
MPISKERLREAVDRLGWSGGDLERAADLPRGYASRLLRGERGRRAPHELVSRIAVALGVTVEWLEAVDMVSTGTRRRAAPVVSPAGPLEAVLTYSLREAPGRWSEYTVETALRMGVGAGGGMTNREIEAWLDRVEAVLGEAVGSRPAPPQSGFQEVAPTQTQARPTRPKKN